MYDLDILEKHQLTQANLKQWLDVDPLAYIGSIDMSDGDKSQSQKRAACLNRIRSRVQEGRARNFTDYKTTYALDTVWDTPFRQVSPTLMMSFLESNPDEAKVLEQLKAWGMTNLVTEEIDRKTGQPTGKKVFDLPVFFNVFVPLVRAYVTIRWAKIMNDRRLLPFFKYEPIKSTADLKIRCEAITDRVQMMSDQYGYYDVLKKCVLNMLHYSECFQFVQEEWHIEETRKIADETDVADQDEDAEEPINVGDEIKVTAKEGLRYHVPHPTRIYYDIAHPPHTLNSDSGCEYAGYWRIIRWRDISENPDYWNKERIALGASDLVAGNQAFFASVYSACTLKVPFFSPPQDPKVPSGDTPAAAFGVGTSPTDREKELANQYYGIDHLDQGVLVTEHFEKLVPADNGFGDYDCPIWMRFMLAGDGCSVIYAAPLAYPPTIYYGYDADAGRLKNASLSLEVLPFQDQFSNVLSQILLTCKQNLANFALVDEDVLKPEHVSLIKNIGERLIRSLNVFGFSGKGILRGQNRMTEVLHTYNLPKGNVAELISVLKTILDVLERVLVMSSHEVAQAASHEQTREEVKNIAQSTSTRLLFTATPVDIARDAWKRQLYWALQAYADPWIYLHIPAETPLTKEQLESMGFTFRDPKTATNGDRYKSVKVKKDKTAIDIWYLAATRDGDDRVNDQQLAVAMAQFAQQLLMNPITAQAVGADQFIDLANRIAQLSGLPRDFKLRNMNPQQSAEEQQQAAQQQLQQVVDTVMQQITPLLQKELEPLLKQVKENTEDVATIMRHLMAGQGANGGAPQPRMMPPVVPSQAPMPNGDLVAPNTVAT